MTFDLQTMPGSDQLSVYQKEFLAFVERNPECLDVANFEELARPEGGWRVQRFLSHYVPIQPWPLLLDSEKANAFSTVALKSFDLIRSLPERLFENESEKITEFYGLDSSVAGALGQILALPWREGREPMRGDFLLCSNELKCIEINAAANAGGIFNFQVAEACLKVPILRRFFTEQDVHVRFCDPWRNLLRTMIEQAVGRGFHDAGRLHLGIVIKWPDEYLSARAIIEPPFRELLEKLAPGIEGKIIFCHYEDLERRGDVLLARGEPVEILMQTRGDILVTPIGVEIQAWIDGVIDLYPGPLNWVYSDKRNLALLSSYDQRPGAFSAEETAWIDRHIPWSRIVRPGQSRFRAEERSLEEVLRSERDSLVLKPVQSVGGIGVLVGRKTSAEEWDETVRMALEYPGTYMVQEFLEDDLYPLQWGEKGCLPCSINWGLFTAGNRFGGIYLRACPPPDNGVVNVSSGALDGCAFELFPAEENISQNDTDLIETFSRR